MKTVLIIAGVVVALVILGLTFAASQPPETGAERVAAIQKSCDEQYGTDTQASVQCRIQLMSEILDKQAADKMDAARRGAGE